MNMRPDNKRKIESDHCIIGITNDNELQFDITRFYEDTDPKVEYHKYVLKFNNREEVVQAVEFFSQLRTETNAIEVVKFLKQMYDTFYVVQHIFGGDITTKTVKFTRVYEVGYYENDFVGSVTLELKFASGFEHSQEVLFDTTFNKYCLEGLLESINNKHLKYLGVK